MTTANVSLGHLFCRLFHRRISIPLPSGYRCLICERRFPVPWGKK